MVEIVGDFFTKNMRLLFVSFVYIFIHLFAFFATVLAGPLLHEKSKDGSGLGFIFYVIFAWPIYLWFSMLIHNIVCYTTSTSGVFYYHDHGHARVMEGQYWALGHNFGSLCMEAFLMRMTELYKLYEWPALLCGCYSVDI